MVTKPNEAKENGGKPKAARLSINQLVVLSAYEKTFSSGKTGFFGQVQDISTGQKYQIIGAVKIG